MATYIETLTEQVTDVVNLAWSEITMIAFVPQLQRFNYANELERAGFTPPYAIVQFGQFQPAREFSGVNVTFRVQINIFYVMQFTASTTTTETARLHERLASLAIEVAKTKIGNAGMEDGSLSIDATENNPIAMLFLARDFPLTGGQVSFNVLTGFGIG